MSDDPRPRIHPVGNTNYVDGEGKVYEPRVYALADVDSIREMVSDALFSFTLGDIPKDVYNAVIAAANVGLKSLEVRTSPATSYDILHALAVEQPGHVRQGPVAHEVADA